MALKTAR